METEILNELEMIRSYLFIIMCAFLLWVAFKIIESSQKIFIGFKNAWETDFDNRMLKHHDTGEYQTIIKECEEKIKKYPNHTNAIWHLAKAYFYTEADDAAKKLFDKAVYLTPSWEEDANHYLEKIKNR